MKIKLILLFTIFLVALNVNAEVSDVSSFKYFVFSEIHRCGGTTYMELDKCLSFNGISNCTGSLEVEYNKFGDGNYTFIIFPNSNCGVPAISGTNFSCRAADGVPMQYTGFKVACYVNDPTPKVDFKYFVFSEIHRCGGTTYMELDRCLTFNGNSNCTGSLEVEYNKYGDGNYSFIIYPNSNCGVPAISGTNFSCNAADGVPMQYTGFKVACYVNDPTPKVPAFKYFTFDQHRCDETRYMELDKCLPVTGNASCTGSLEVEFNKYGDGNYTFIIYPDGNCGRAVSGANFSCNAADGVPMTYAGFTVACYVNDPTPKVPDFKYFVFSEIRRCGGTTYMELYKCLPFNGISNCTGSLEVEYNKFGDGNYTFIIYPNNNCGVPAISGTNFSCSAADGVPMTYTGFKVACYVNDSTPTTITTTSPSTPNPSNTPGNPSNSNSIFNYSIIILIFTLLFTISLI